MGKMKKSFLSSKYINPPQVLEKSKIKTSKKQQSKFNIFSLFQLFLFSIWFRPNVIRPVILKYSSLQHEISNSPNIRWIRYVVLFLISFFFRSSSTPPHHHLGLDA